MCRSVRTEGQGDSSRHRQTGNPDHLWLHWQMKTRRACDYGSTRRILFRTFPWGKVNRLRSPGPAANFSGKRVDSHPLTFLHGKPTCCLYETRSCHCGDSLCACDPRRRPRPSLRLDVPRCSGRARRAFPCGAQRGPCSPGTRGRTTCARLRLDGNGQIGRAVTCCTHCGNSRYHGTCSRSAG